MSKGSQRRGASREERERYEAGWEMAFGRAFRIGDRVVCRTPAKSDMGSVTFAQGMIPYIGETMTIQDIDEDGCILLEHRYCFWWHPSWLERAP